MKGFRRKIAGSTHEPGIATVIAIQECGKVKCHQVKPLAIKPAPKYKIE
jgi:hypothetical protein